jgi:hypothetical protein
MFISAPLIVNNPDISFIDRVYDEYGPTPRICLVESSSPQRYEQYSHAVEHAVNALKLEHFMSQDGMVILEGSQGLFLIRRRRAAETDSLTFVSAITDRVSMKMAAAFRQLTRAEQVRAYDKCLGYPGSRALSGTMYEPYCQEQFKTRIKIEYLPMVRLPDSDPSVKRHQWHTTHRVLGGKLEHSRLGALSRKENLSVDTRASHSSSTPKTILERRPSRKISSTFRTPRTESHWTHSLCTTEYSSSSSSLSEDSTILRRDSSPSLKGGAAGFPPLGNVRLIFVIPGDVRMKTPFARSDELAKIPLYSSVFEVKE